MKIDIFGIFGPKTEKMGRARKWVFFNFAHFFFIESKSIENTKKFSPQIIKVCKKKFPPFKMKKWIFGHFHVLTLYDQLDEFSIHPGHIHTYIHT